MEVEDAYRILQPEENADGGRYFNFNDRTPIGAGTIIDRVILPFFDRDERRYRTAEGLIYVVSHECDIDRENIRPFNDSVLICPIIPLDVAIADLNNTLDDEQLNSFLSNLRNHLVFRVAYLPQIDARLPFGGFLYLNQITSTHVDSVLSENAEWIANLSAYGMRSIDYIMMNLLFRPKAAVLPP